MKTLGFLPLPSHLVAQLFLAGDMGLLVAHPHWAEEEPLLMFTEGLFSSHCCKPQLCLIEPIVILIFGED